MKILLSDFIIICDEEFRIIEGGAVVFEEKIVDVGGKDEILAKYKNAQIIELEKNSVIMPGLINSHIHLEFSANIASLKFGDFMLWLKSVIALRDELQQECSKELISKTLSEIIKSGVTTIGAISSFGLDYEPCLKSHLNVVYFIEALGSNPAALDALYEHFQARFYEALEAKNSSFFPAISVHSPYSTHPILAAHVLDIARKNRARVTAHFMESPHEREWLDKGNGAMSEFMKAFNPHAKPMSSAKEFLELFAHTNTIFAHAVQATDEELLIIKKQGGSIAHCPRSNRLLGTGALDIKNAQNIGVPLLLGTDGLSSNISLNIWDEMRAALFTHQYYDLSTLAVLLLKSASVESGKAFGLNKGKLEAGFDADIIALSLKELPRDISQLPLQIILQTSEAKRVYIGGVEQK